VFFCEGRLRVVFRAVPERIWPALMIFLLLLNGVPVSQLWRPSIFWHFPTRTLTSWFAFFFWLGTVEAPGFAQFASLIC